MCAWTRWSSCWRNYDPITWIVRTREKIRQLNDSKDEIRLYGVFLHVSRLNPQVRELDALLEVDAAEVRLAVQAMGRTGVRLQWDGQSLMEQRAAWLPDAVRSERVLDDVQFSLWPADAVRAVLPAGWELHEAGDVRELRRDGRAWLVRERTSATTLQVRNRADGYDLTIESVAGGAPSP